MIIPFFIPHAGCPHQCVFCNQKNITGSREPVDPATIPSAVERYLATRSADEPVQVAFYGGSFTALPREKQRSYLEAVQPFLANGTVDAVRLSTRPDNVSPAILSLLKLYRVRTVELGVQSMSDRVLELSGRGHTAAHTAEAARLLREYGFTTGLQLMPGLPGDSAAGFADTVAKTIALRPAFVRIYPALVIKGTPLEMLYRTGTYAPLPLEQAVDVCRHAVMEFEAAGIDVIRIGLQPTEELEKTGTIVAGPYHPAFRQLVESAILLDSMRRALAGSNPKGGTRTVFVHPLDLSNAIGQKRTNLETLRKEYGKDIRVQADDRVKRREAKLEKSKSRGQGPGDRGQEKI